MYPTESLDIDTQGVMPDGKGHIDYDPILNGSYYRIMDYDGRTIVDNVYECTIYGYSYGQETIPFRKNGKAYKIGADHEVYRDYENE